MAGINTEITQLIGPVLQQMGYELVGIEYVRSGKYSTLRVYIDIDIGITVDDCAKVSEQISAILDVEEPITGQYHLEVSSPGIERPLFTLAHYRRFLGSRVNLKLFRGLSATEFGQKNSDRKKFIGEIKTVLETKNSIEIATELENFIFSFDDIEKANLMVDF